MLLTADRISCRDRNSAIDPDRRMNQNAIENTELRKIHSMITDKIYKKTYMQTNQHSNQKKHYLPGRSSGYDLRKQKQTAYPAFVFLCVLMMAAVLSGCGAGFPGASASAEPVTGENYYLDTICTVSIFEMADAEGISVPASEMKEEADTAISAAFELCAEMDKKLSRTNESSEISKVNNSDGEWTEVSDDTAELVGSGIEYSKLADGRFDITIGGVTDLWDFHADPENAKLPDKHKLAEALKHVDYNNIEIDSNMLRLDDPKTKIDLGAIAKGYIGDRMTEVLEDRGVTSGIVNLGGNVICIGGKTADDDFTVGVEAPFSDRTEIVGKVKCRNKTLVTSGVYERKIEVGGKLYHHILDPETGYSVKTDLDAVTLIADKGRSMDIDAMSTICLIKGYNEAKEFIEETDGVEAVFIKHDGSIDKTDGASFEAE